MIVDEQPGDHRRGAATRRRGAIAARLEEARARTLLLIEGVSDEALNEVHDPLMSPIAWDLGHIATFEDLWLAQNPFGRPPLRGRPRRRVRPVHRAAQRARRAALSAHR